MAQYAGLDVSVKETAICVVDAAGGLVRQGKVPTTIEAIASTLARYAPRGSRSGSARDAALDRAKAEAIFRSSRLEKGESSKCRTSETVRPWKSSTIIFGAG